MDVEDSQSKIEIVDSLNASQTSLTSDDLTNLSTGASEVEETLSATGKVPDSEEKNSNHYEVPTSDAPPIDLEQMSSNTMETSSSDYQEKPRNKQRVHNIGDDTQLDTVLTTNEPTMDTDSISEEFKPHINNDNVDNIQSKESDFGFAEHDENDDFGEFGDFDATGDGLSNGDDEFGDFGEFDEVSEVDNAEEPQLEPGTNIEGMEDYVESLRDGNVHNVVDFLNNFFDKNLPNDTSTSSYNDADTTLPNQHRSGSVQSPSQLSAGERSKALLSTEASVDLWDKLSTDSVFYNPITGAVGQFQWTRSEINKVYLRSLGVTINVDDAFHHSSSSVPSSPYMDTIRSPNSRASQGYMDKKSPSPRLDRKRSPKHHHSKANSLSGINLPVRDTNTVEPKKPEPEPELDIDIARAYCELTEDTVRVFPAVKLTSIITDLTRLQRQASDYLQYLLDQREQLIMDSETYNDLISCIVGHAQRLREQNPKDASPAMVQKKKQGKCGSLSLSGLSLKRRSQAASSGQAAFSASMGGGVVGIKNSTAGTGTRKIERGHSTGSIIPVATTSTPSHKTANNESLLD